MESTLNLIKVVVLNGDELSFLVDVLEGRILLVL